MKISETEFYIDLRKHDVWVMEEPLIGAGIIGRTDAFVYYPAEHGDTRELFYVGFCPEEDIDLDSSCATIYFSIEQVLSAIKVGKKTYRLSGQYDGGKSPHFSQQIVPTITIRFCNLAD